VVTGPSQSMRILTFGVVKFPSKVKPDISTPRE
jgi:hypothetical protein